MLTVMTGKVTRLIRKFQEPQPISGLGQENDHQEGQHAQHKPKHENIVGVNQQLVLPVQNQAVVVHVHDDLVVNSFPGFQDAVHLFDVFIERFLIVILEEREAPVRFVGIDNELGLGREDGVDS